MNETPLSEAELQSLVQELMTEAERNDATEAIYSLLGIYQTDWVPENIKAKIGKFFREKDYHWKDIIDDVGLGVMEEIRQLENEWSRESAWGIVMKKQGREDNGKMNKKSDEYLDPLNPTFLPRYFENFKNIYKNIMSRDTDEQLYQEGFNQLIDNMIPKEHKYDESYLTKIVDMARRLEPPINIEIPTNIIMEVRRQKAIKEEKEEAEHVVKEKQQRKERGALTLEEQMVDAIAEERYEDAAEIKEKMDMLQRVMGNWHGSLTVKEGNIIDKNDLVVYADNLDLVQPDKPYDTKQHDQLRQRHYKRYRNEPGGSDEVLWEGLGSGYNDVDKGIGSDQYQDVGCPSSINIASDKIKKLVRPTDPNMPNEKMERSMEEKEVTDTWREFNSMEAR